MKDCIHENIKVNHKLFYQKGQLGIQAEAFRKDLSRKKPSLQIRLKKALEKLKIANQSVREKEDTIDMLNIIVENKKSELNILKEQLIEPKMRKVLYAVQI